MISMVTPAIHMLTPAIARPMPSNGKVTHFPARKTTVMLTPESSPIKTSGRTKKRGDASAMPVHMCLQVPEEAIKTPLKRQLKQEEVTNYAISPHLALAVWENIDESSQKRILVEMTYQGRTEKYCDAFAKMARAFVANPNAVFRHYDVVVPETGNGQDFSEQYVSEKGWLQLARVEVFKNRCGQKVQKKVWSNMWVDPETGRVRMINSESKTSAAFIETIEKTEHPNASPSEVSQSSEGMIMNPDGTFFMFLPPQDASNEQDTSFPTKEFELHQVYIDREGEGSGNPIYRECRNGICENYY